VKENQGNQEAIEDFVDDWKATEEEKTNARGTILTNPGNWKKSVIKEYDFFKDTEWGLCNIRHQYVLFAIFCKIRYLCVILVTFSYFSR
jgi:hypothetical protein